MIIGVLGPVQGQVDRNRGPRELEAIASGGTRLRTYVPRVSAFAYTPVEFAIQQISYLEAGIEAAADGCDALVYNTLAEYGLAALKAAVDIPVIGAGEAALRFAPSLGARFSIVTVWPASTNFKPEALLREYELTRHCVSIRNVGTEDILSSGGARPDGFIAGMQAGRDGTLDRIVAACEATVREDRADVIVLGCTCMSPIADRIAERCPVPVVNPLAVALKTAEMQVGLGLRPRGPGRSVPRLASFDLVRRMVEPVASTPTVCAVCLPAAAE